MSRVSSTVHWTSLLLRRMMAELNVGSWVSSCFPLTIGSVSSLSSLA